MVEIHCYERKENWFVVICVYEKGYGDAFRVFQIETEFAPHVDQPSFTGPFRVRLGKLPIYLWGDSVRILWKDGSISEYLDRKFVEVRR